MIQTKKQALAPVVKSDAVLVTLLLGFALAACSRRQATPPPAPEVATVTVIRQEIQLSTELPGRTSPYRVAEIRPQVHGIILKRLFTEGSDVQAGQTLYQINPAPFQAALNNARAGLVRAESKLPSVRSRVARYKEALADKAVSQQDFDDAEGGMKQAEADVQYWEALVETARIELGYTRIVAPISGRIGKSAVTDGALVTAYQPLALATVQQLNPIYVDVPQSSIDLLRDRLSRGGKKQDRVRLIQEDGTKYPQDGTLQFRDVSVDAMTGSVILRSVFPNPNGTLLPGMFVRAVISEGADKQAILVPQQAVSRDPKGNPTVLIVGADGKVAQKMLTLDRAIGDQWLVASGLEPGDRVIVEGMQKVRPGASARVVPFTPSPQETAGQGPKPGPTAN